MQVDNRIADKFGETPVPPLSLQLLVENVIKHNVISMKKPMTVRCGRNRRETMYGFVWPMPYVRSREE